ncbi:hypothetical protein [Sporosarcina koreensis]|uniref:Uncharacterized protein n=1 Tax=Sporosarcina koreensis TaxID=334735 RepID=A0ABW0TVF2_9BACL
MYFIDQEHKGNYEWMMERMKLISNQDVQFESTVYIGAIPDIFRKLDKFKMKPSDSPLWQLTEWDEEKGEHKFTHPALTGSTRRMCEFAVSLFNGYPVGLDEVLGSVTSEKFRKSLVQAFKIRAQIK